MKLLTRRGLLEYNISELKGSVQAARQAVLRSGRVNTEADQMLGGASRPRRGDKASPRRGLKFPTATDARKGIAADSQHETA